MKTLVRTYGIRAFFIFLLSCLIGAVVLAQDNPGTQSNNSSSTTTTETTTTTWYAQPWVWVVGGALVVLILVLALRGRGESSTTVVK